MSEPLLLWASLGLSVLVAMGAAAYRPAPSVGEATPPASPPVAGNASRRAALLLPFLGFFLTLPASRPFAAGQGLGTGFLLGGLGALLLAWVAQRRGDGEPDAGGAGLALPAVPVALCLLFLRPVLLDALFGVGIGWFATAFLSLLTARDTDTIEGRSRRFLAGPLTFGTIVAVTLAAGAVLGTFRDERTTLIARGMWGALALVLASGSGFLNLLLNWVARPAADATTGRRVISPVVGVGLAALLGLLLATKVAGKIEVFEVWITGLLLWPVVVWVHRSAQNRRPLNPALPSLGDSVLSGPSILSVLLLTGGFMLAGQQLLGYGAAVFLLGALVSAGVLWPVIRSNRPSSSFAPLPLGLGEGSHRVGGAGGWGLQHNELSLLLFGATLVLYRAFLGRWADEVRGVNLTDHYALFGFLVGAVTPSYLARVASDVAGGLGNSARPLIRAAICGLLTLAVPGAVVLLFGAKAALALLLGLALGGLLGGDVVAGLMAVAIGLVLGQWAGHALPYADMTRVVRLRTLCVLVVLLVAVVAAAQAGGKAGAASSEETEAGQ